MDPRPPSPMKELNVALVQALKQTIEDAQKPDVTIECRALALQRCAEAFQALDQASTTRMVANYQAQRDTQR